MKEENSRHHPKETSLMRGMSTNKPRTIITSAAALAVTAGLAITTVGAASATTLPNKPLPREAYGSVELAGPLQSESFLALQGGRYHGAVDYTNWTYAEPGSGVFAPAAGSHALVFTYQGSQYAHTLNDGLKLYALSPERLAFSGSGSYSGGTWTIRGQVDRGRVNATIAYDGQSYKVFMTGKVARDGSVYGIARSSTKQTLTFTMPAGSFASVLHYIAPIQSAQVQRHNATFKFTIPARVAGLAGTRVTVKVHDGGFGPRHDLYAHGVTGTQLSQYPIIGGPGITIR
jgi:hypothetical protein